MKKNPGVRTVFFHNFSRFDGILLLRFFTEQGDKYHVRTLMRKNRLYELRVSQRGKMLFRFRDSLTLLPNSLAKLAKTLCPQLGSKGTIQHEEVNVSNLMRQREELISYLKQDILLLGGIMLKAQEIYWSKFQIDTEDTMTLSALAMKIFRQKLDNDKNFPIHLPNRNEDTFIRRGYYGGHTDVYLPYGESLYYYDVNSLYPFIMKSYPMPGGVPVWMNNLEEVDLDSLFGFFEAYVVCPSHITRPFLPYKFNKFLVFPTGQFIGVYYSEELKYALGYEITPLRGYQFEKICSPFESFITNLYDSRQEARRDGDDAMVYI